MKNLLFIFLISLGTTTMGQITLDHTYLDAGRFNFCPTAGGPNGYAFGTKPFYLVHLEIDGDKYVCIDRVAQTMTFYNLNHTLFTSINYSNVYTGIYDYGTAPDFDKLFSSILYISQSLFECDREIEFMYTTNHYNYEDTTYRAITQIVKQDGSIIFSDSAAPLVQATYHNQYYPIYNTSNGTKMILSNVNGSIEIFNLCGTFTQSIAENNILSEESNLISNPYPNPAMDYTKIDYELPDGIKEGEIIFFNLQGNEVKRFRVDRTFNTIFISTSDITAGTYYYQLQTTGQNSDGKKLIVIK